MAVADDEHREIWGPAATELLANLLLAAHLAHGTLLDAYRWLYDESNDAPVRILRAAGQRVPPPALAGVRDPLRVEGPHPPAGGRGPQRRRGPVSYTHLTLPTKRI